MGEGAGRGNVNTIQFDTAEQMAAWQEEHDADYMITMGSEGFRLIRRLDMSEVAFVRDERAAILAMQALEQMVL